MTNLDHSLTAPLMLDVDTGVDDALAIAFAIRMNANVIGISTVAGNVPIDHATGNTLQVLSWMDADAIPVHRGASRPLAADYHDAAHVHGADGLGGADLVGGSAEESHTNGVAAILDNAERYKGEILLIALGPLTNIAIALSLRPALVRQVRKLVVMGGAYGVMGNVTPHAEFNVFADPHAGAQVFAADWNEVIAVGLDVTHQTSIARDQWEATTADATGAAGLVRRIVARTFTERGLDGFYLHDPLAVAVALHPDLVDMSSSSITVTLDGERRGKTKAADNGRVRLATGVDAERFETMFAVTLSLQTRKAGVAEGRSE